MSEAIPDAAFFRALEVRRTRALVERDLAVIVALHAPEYELVTPTCKVFSRRAYLDAIAEAPFYADWECDEHGAEMQVRIVADMAIVRYRARLTFPSGRVVVCWHTDSYERRPVGWQAVWSQATATGAVATDSKLTTATSQPSQ